MKFEIIGDITEIEVMVVGSSIRDLERLREFYGDGRWRKMKGVATILLDNAVYARQNCTGMKHTALAAKSSKENAIWIDAYERR